MRESLFRRLFLAALFAIIGFFGYQQAAQAQAASCFTVCFDQHANDTDLTCCGGKPCDGREYCDMVCGCGDGQLNGDFPYCEQCDDGNSDNGDGCSNTCETEQAPPQHESCGDGVLDEDCGNPEECDDGNHRNGDGCDENCMREEPLPGADSPTLPTVKYRGVDSDDLFSLRATVNKDLNIQPGDAVVPAIRGYYAPGPVNLQATVIPKFTAALQAIFRALFPNFTGFAGANTAVPMDNPIGCTYSRDFCFTLPPPPGGSTSTTVCSKGCRETKPIQWSAGNQCLASMGCCTNSTIGCLFPRAAAPDDPETPENDPITADSIRGNGIY
ncbi:MAG TPA: hypothetical protein VFX30_10825 [bacterium]|nr:hypothetical protein [bacterium]